VVEHESPDVEGAASGIDSQEVAWIELGGRADAIDTLPWMHEASNPYWDWLWGSPEEARLQLRSWMRRSNSELAERRILSLVVGGRIVGGYIAMPGNEVRVCRTADLLSMANYLRRKPNEQIIERMRLSRGLFTRPKDDEFYLSRMGIALAARGRGAGRRLVARVLEEGRSKNITVFRLDVFADNEVAIRLYRSTGFIVAAESRVPGTPLRYYSMLASL
jgi:GNAT superfamily N-acetyltransferase